MAKIFITGQRDPLYLPDDKAKPLKRAFESNTLGEIVRIGDTATVRREQIKSVFLDNERDSDNSVTDNVTRSYEADRRTILAKSPAVRGQSTGFAELVYYALTGEKDMPAQLRPTVIERQVAYFTENPGHCLVNPTIFKDLFRITTGNIPDAVNADGVKIESMVGHARLAAERFIENALGTDRAYAFKSR